jgi:hypothetical protein
LRLIGRSKNFRIKVEQNFVAIYVLYKQHVPKAWVCDHSLAGILGLILAGTN